MAERMRLDLKKPSLRGDIQKKKEKVSIATSISNKVLPRKKRKVAEIQDHNSQEKQQEGRDSQQILSDLSQGVALVPDSICQSQEDQDVCNDESYFEESIMEPVCKPSTRRSQASKDVHDREIQSQSVVKPYTRNRGNNLKNVVKPPSQSRKPRRNN